MFRILQTTQATTGNAISKGRLDDGPGKDVVTGFFLWVLSSAARRLGIAFLVLPSDSIPLISACPGVIVSWFTVAKDYSALIPT